MACLNRVTLVGRLDVEPELKKTKTGIKYANVKVATWRPKKFDPTKEKQEYETDWHSVSLWEKTAETCYKYMRKGEMVIVEGELKNVQWMAGPNKDEKRYKTEIRATRFLSLNRFVEKEEKPLSEEQLKQLATLKPNDSEMD